MTEALLAQGGAAALAASGVAMLWRGRAQWALTAVLMALGVAGTAAAIALRWSATGQGPFLTLYEVVLSSIFSLSLVCLLSWARWPVLRRGAPFALGFIALLSAWCLTLASTVVPLPPSFHHPWLWAHVLSGKLFLAFLLVSVGLALRLLTSQRAAADARDMEAHLWRFAALAFVFDSLMLVTGAVWARDAWGRYWAWDPLETSALVTWLVLALLLHVRLALRWPARIQWLSMAAVFALAALTIFGLPFFSLAPHKGFL